ncbi:MAG: rod shape-determining protein MreD [Clostridiales Family XIII bacterium]|jgi:rod shape-determining protein MreD|nr:rod shape-determining protein MreD [Clostridiales Family XIII bacterium]
MRMRSAAIVFVVAFAIQPTLLRCAAIGGVTPNLLLCLVIVFAFLYDEPMGLALGAAFGLLWDLAFGLYAGVSGISFMATALAMTRLRKYLNHELPLPAIVAGVVGSSLNSLVYWGIYKLAGAPHSLMYILDAQPALIAYNVVAVFALHLALRGGVIRHRKDQYYKGGFREANDLRLAAQKIR